MKTIFDVFNKLCEVLDSNKFGITYSSFTDTQSNRIEIVYNNKTLVICNYDDTLAQEELFLGNNNYPFVVCYDLEKSDMVFCEDIAAAFQTARKAYNATIKYLSTK